MNTIIRVIQSLLSVIILSRVAALHWCHCRAINASLIATTANMTHSQRWLNSFWEESRCLSDSISACKSPSPFIPKNFLHNLSLFYTFTPFYPQCRKRKSKQETVHTVYLLQLLTLSLLVFFMHCPRGIFFCLARVQFQQLCGAPGVARGYVHIIQGWFHDHIKERIWAPLSENLTDCCTNLPTSPML